MTTITVNGETLTVPTRAIAYKLNDPTEDARWIFDEDDLAAIRREDPGLIIEVDVERDLAQAGAEREEAARRAEEVAQRLRDSIIAAHEAGVPVARIAQLAGVSRQYVYTLLP